MFKESSRYAKQRTVEVKLENGRKATAITLRRLPPTTGLPTLVKPNDRLDVIALRKYKDSSKFWHIADANTELQARDLIKSEPPENPLVSAPAISILIPEK
jgi:hypothetical protein